MVWIKAFPFYRLLAIFITGIPNKYVATDYVAILETHEQVSYDSVRRGRDKNGGCISRALLKMYYA